MTDSEEMDKILKAFSNASIDVVKQMTGCKIEPGGTLSKEHFYPSYDYSIIIGVTGEYEGAVTMSFKEETAFFLVSAMMGNKPVEQFDKMAESAVCELANQAVSRSLLLAANGKPFDITPPTLVKGRNVSFAVANINKTKVATLNTPQGIVEFNISLSKKK